MDFQTIYTGINSAARIPDLDVMHRAEEKFYDTIAAKDEQKYQRDKLDEREYLEAIKTDPVALISNKATQEQAIAIEDYNNKWGKIRVQRARSGGLTTQDKVNMQRDKQALMTLQNKWAANQQRFWADKEVMDKDTKGYYDQNTFNAAMKNFYNTGEYPTSALMAAPQDFVTILKGKNIKGTEQQTQQYNEKTGYIQDVSSNMTLDESKRLVTDQILTNDSYLMKALRDFNDPANAKDVEKYLTDYDVNKNGVIDPKEKQTALSEPMNLNNPIIKWAQDYYGPQIISTTVGSSKRATTGSSNSKSVSIGGSAWKYNPSVGNDAIIGSTRYTLFPWYKKTAMNVPLNNARVLREGGDIMLRNPQTIQGVEFTGIGQKADGGVEFLFKIPSDNYMNLGQPAGTNIAVPASELPDLQDVEVEVDGKLVKVKNLMNQQSQTKQPTVKKSGVNWK